MSVNGGGAATRDGGGIEQAQNEQETDKEKIQQDNFKGRAMRGSACEDG